MPLNPLAEPGNALKYEIILTEDWQNLRFVFTTMKTVILSVVRVLNLQGISEVLPVDFVTCSDFLASLQAYFTMISQGSFARDEIFDLTLEIITSSPKVGVECSARVRFLAESILKSVMNYQLLFTTDLVILQMKLTQILRVQVTSLQITFAGISEQGSLVEYQQGTACELRQEDFYQEKISQHRTSIENIQELCDSVSALFDIHETTASRTTGAVSSSEFMEKLGSLVIDLSEDINSLDAEDVLAIKSLSMGASFSDREKAKLDGIKTTLVSYTVQLGAEVAMAYSELQNLEMQGETGSVPTNTDIVTLKNDAATIISITQKLRQISEYVEEAQLGCSTTNPTQSSEEFFDLVLDNVLLPLAGADVRSEIEPDSCIWEVLGPLREYHNIGIRCLKGSNKGNMLVIKTVLEVYIDMLKLDLASVQEEILELEGSCPLGSEPGDWSDGSGDCCCSKAPSKYLINLS